MGGYRLLGLGARRSCLVEEVIVRHVVLVLELVDELLVDECEEVVVFQLDLVGLSGRSVSPSMASELRSHDHRCLVQVSAQSAMMPDSSSGSCMRTQRRNRAKAATIVRDHERHTVDRELLRPFSGTSVTLQTRFQLMTPRSCRDLRHSQRAGIAPVRRKSRRATLLRSASATPCRAAIVETHFPLDETGPIVLEPERIDVAADQEQPAFSGIDVRVHAVEQVLVDHERADGGGGLAVLGDVDGRPSYAAAAANGRYCAWAAA